MNLLQHDVAIIFDTKAFRKKIVSVITVAIGTTWSLTFAGEHDDLYGYVDREYFSENFFDPSGLAQTPAFPNKTRWSQRLSRMRFLQRELNLIADDDQRPLQLLREQHRTRLGMNALQGIDPDQVLRRFFLLGAQTLTLKKNDLSGDREVFALGSLSKRGRVAHSSVILNRKTWAQLRVAIDPGHMESAEWEPHTGKFVQVGGVRVSEGHMNRLVALELSQALRARGASVFLTRETDRPVGTFVMGESPLRFASRTLYDAVLGFLVPTIDATSGWLMQVRALPRVQTALNPDPRSQFIRGTDLEARSEQITAFRPDITLIIHFDASDNYALQNRNNDIEAYVPGGFRFSELGSAWSRGWALQHAFRSGFFEGSVRLSRAVVRGLSQSLGLPLLNTPEFLSGVRIEPGVYARNLALTRMHSHGAVSYIEALHYDHMNEFYRLADLSTKFIYNGVPYRTSPRLQQVVAGIVVGLEGWVRGD